MGDKVVLTVTVDGETHSVSSGMWIYTSCLDALNRGDVCLFARFAKMMQDEAAPKSTKCEQCTECNDSCDKTTSMSPSATWPFPTGQDTPEPHYHVVRVNGGTFVKGPVTLDVANALIQKNVRQKKAMLKAVRCN